jgi:hypothetical protein
MCAALTSGCLTHHVNLPRIPADPSPRERIAAYASYRPQPGTEVYERTCDRTGCTTQKLLLLANGTTVHEADDLLPLVPAGSETARAAKASARLRTTSHWFFLATAAALATGLVIMGSANMDGRDNDLKIGAAVLVVGVGTSGALWLITGKRGERRRDEAFDHYERDLASNLRVCVSGLQLYPCELEAPPPTQGPEPDPVLRELRQQ